MTFEIDSIIRRNGRLPLIYGHRGARGEFPESSLEGFRFLADLGIQAVEFDVQNAQGREPIVWHDPTFEAGKVRNADGAWLKVNGPKVIETSTTQLKTYDIGSLDPHSKNKEAFPDQVGLEGVTIPTLKEFCSWAQDCPQMVLNLEVKSFANRADLGDSPDVLRDSILSVIQQFDLEQRTIVSSFDWRVLSEFRRSAPNIRLGFLTYSNLDDPLDDANVFDNSPWMDGWELSAGKRLPELVKQAGGTVWSPYYTELTQEDLELAHALGLVVNVWTVNTEDDLRHMKDMGVDGVITDYPTRAKALWEEMLVGEEQGNLSDIGGLKSQGKISVIQPNSTE